MILFLLFIASGEVVDKSLCPNSCNNNGECTQVYETNNETMTDYTFCDCFSGFTTNDCSQCSEGRFGQLCKLCPIHNKKVCAGHGLCDGGINGTGTCLCEGKFSSESGCSEEIRFLEIWPSLAEGTFMLILAAVLCILLIVLMSKAPFLPRSAGSIILGIILGFGYSILNPKASFNDALFFKPQIFFLILIPPIMFEAGFSLKRTDFFNNIGTILILAVIGTMLTAIIFGVLLYTVCNLFHLYPFSLVEALLFGSLISATDPVATISINKLLNLSSSLNAIIFGESVLNDAISIALFRVFSEIILDAEVQ